jgi:hypothetical protein
MWRRRWWRLSTPQKKFSAPQEKRSPPPQEYACADPGADACASYR